MDELKVSIKAKREEYSIFIGGDLLARTGDLLDTEDLSDCALIVSDENTEPYADQVESSLTKAGFSVKRIVIPPGEGEKSLPRLLDCYDLALTAGPDRRSPLFAVGGGVVGDLGGLVAATLFRGLPFIQVPTTLLAQVDSSVGGKVAVNHNSGKNLIGAFYQPCAVFADPKTLDTLPVRQFSSGLAEVIKYGVIWDRNFFSWLEENMDDILERDPGVVSQMIRECCRIKAEVVGRDERDTGLRMILNYGHTLGHALEAAARKDDRSSLLHGEAVAMGMAASVRLAAGQGWLAESVECRQNRLIKRAGLSLDLPKLSPEELREYMFRDKKRMRGTLNFVLPRDLGKVEISQRITFEEILSAYRELVNEGGC